MTSRKVQPKSPDESAVVMTEIVLPIHTNALGTIFGGTVMSWIDIAAAIAAGRHARTTVVTASIDSIHFAAPILLGHVVEIKARVNYVSRSSMEVGVHVESENPKTGARTQNVSAFTTFVALDEARRPVQVAPLKLVTEADKKMANEAKRRRESRLALRNKAV